MEKTGGAWRMVAAMGLSGTIGVAVLLSGQSPSTVAFFRCLIGSAALLGWLAWTGGWKRPDPRALAWIVAGAVAIIANWLCLFHAFALAGISVATVVYHVQPFFLIVLAALAQREMPAWRKLPWLLLAFAGVALTTGLDSGAGAGPGTSAASLGAGVLLALAAAFLYALATLSTRKLPGYAPAQIAGLQLLIGVAALLPLLDFSMERTSAVSWTWLAVIGLVHTGLVYNLMYGAFQRLRADTVATLSFIYPAVAVLADMLVFDARLAPLQWTGMGMIIASMLANQFLSDNRAIQRTRQTDELRHPGIRSGRGAAQARRLP